VSILDDPRVKPLGADGYQVATDTGIVNVLHSDMLGWGLYTGPRLEMVITGSGPAIGIVSAEAAIKAVLR
jgi:hypothetical protein